MRKSTAFLLLTALLTLAVGLLLLQAGFQRRALLPQVQRTRQLAAALELTDLALFNEARYTRHPSQADLHTAFQDHPFSLEHFPTGSLVPPTALLRKAP